MSKLFQRKLRFKLLSGMLITATLQFFVPLVNTAFAERCCNSTNMQCCQEEFPSRMVCCKADANQGLNESAPTQGILPKSQKTPECIIVSLAASAIYLIAQSSENLEYFLTLEFSFTDNKLYKKFSTFLI